MKTFLISPDDGFDEISLLPDLFSAGLDVFHLRKPNFSGEMLRKYLHDVPEDCRSRIVLHSYHELCEEFTLYGVHLPEFARLNTAFRRKITELPGNLSISTSFHKLVDLHSRDYAFDYVFFSPVFPAISKRGYNPAYHWETMVERISGSSFNVVALGGMDANKIEFVSAAGFYGYAFKGAVWMANNPVKAWQKIVNNVICYDKY